MALSFFVYFVNFHISTDSPCHLPRARADDTAMPALTWDSGIKYDTAGVVWDGLAVTNKKHKMAEQDLAQVRADDAWITELNTRLQAVITHLATKAVDLTTEQRRRAPGIGQENASMVERGTAIIRDNAEWFPPLYKRTELLADVADREKWLLAKSNVMKAAELYDDTLQAIESDIVRGILAAKPYIEQSADLTGQNNNLVAEFLEWFKRFGASGTPAAPVTPPTPPV